jgi:hypothetical protein
MPRNPTELEQELQQFIGTERYYRVRNDLLATDGVKYLAEQAECFWLLDLYWSHLLGIDHHINPFTALKMTVQNSAAYVVIEDGNDNVLAQQFVEYTDFPLASITLYGCWAEQEWVVMLTSEY